MGFSYVQIFANEASGEKKVIGLETRDAIIEATDNYIDEIARYGVAVFCISGDGAGEFG